MPKKQKEQESSKIKEFKEFIESTFKQLSDDYFIIDFVHVYFHYGLNQKPRCEDGDLIFDINYTPHYRQCHINVHGGALEMWERNQKEELIGGMIHELSHMHTQKIVEAAENRFITKKEIHTINEELTETIAEYVRRLKTMAEDNYKLKGRKQDKTITSKPRKQRSLDNTKK